MEIKDLYVMQKMIKYCFSQEFLVRYRAQMAPDKDFTEYEFRESMKRWQESVDRQIDRTEEEIAFPGSRAVFSDSRGTDIANNR